MIEMPVTPEATSQQQFGTYGTRGTLTIGFVAVGGFNANQDVLVQQVLRVGDNGLQLQREVHGIRGDKLGIGR